MSLARLALPAALVGAAFGGWGQPATGPEQQVEISFTAANAQGQAVTDLQPGDIAISEDKHPQKIAGLRRIDADARGTPEPPSGGEPRFDGGQFDGHRLIVLYFDLTELTPRDCVAAQRSAAEFVAHEMRPNDLVAVAVLAGSLQMTQDFTPNQETLRAAIGSIDPNSGLNQTPPGGDLTSADRSFNALMSMHQGLASLQPRKLEVFYSSGIDQSGDNNAYTLRAATDAAVKGNIAIYAVDARLLPDRAVGGSATRPSSATGLPAQQLAHSLNGQNALSALGNDSGGAALLDSGADVDFYTRMEDASRFYYIATYTPTNSKPDGKYRKVEVTTARPGVTISAMPGYIAPKK